MKFIISLALAATLSTAAAAEEKQPLDPAATVKQLYMLGAKKSSSAASFTMYSDGTYVFAVQLTNDTRVYGYGTTPEAALADLQRKTGFVIDTAVQKAEETKSAAVSLYEGIKAMLLGGRSSQ